MNTVYKNLVLLVRRNNHSVIYQRDTKSLVITKEKTKIKTKTTKWLCLHTKVSFAFVVHWRQKKIGPIHWCTKSSCHCIWDLQVFHKQKYLLQAFRLSCKTKTYWTWSKNKLSNIVNKGKKSFKKKAISQYFMAWEPSFLNNAAPIYNILKEGAFIRKSLKNKEN